MSGIVVALPGAQQNPVLQQRRRGRLPQSVASIGAASLRREARELAEADAAKTSDRVVQQLLQQKDKARARHQALEVAVRYIPAWTDNPVLNAARAKLTDEARECEKLIQSFDAWLLRGHS